MKTKIINILNFLLKVWKEDIWTYRYYYVLFVIFLTTFTLEMLTISRVMRFLGTCLILMIYKTLHNYIEKMDWSNFNIKYLPYLMWINVLQNPILNIIWKWDLYMYIKLKNIMDIYIQNPILNMSINLLILNISMPIKILYIRFYMILDIVKMHTLKELMFNRIYGFLISILIFSDIIKTMYQVVGGPFNLIIYIYLIMYSINVIYIFFYYFFEKKQIIFITKLKNYYNKWYIYLILKKYFNILNQINIGIVYAIRVDISIIGNCIKKILMSSFTESSNALEILTVTHKILALRKFLYKIPENWRYLIYEMRLLFKAALFFESYWDNIIMLKINWLTLETLKMNKNINYNYIYYNNHYNIYIQIFFILYELFKTFESVLYYKYYVYKKGSKKNIEILKNEINIKEYNYIYKMHLLILKNILHFIWSFEYNILQDKNKLTRFHVIEDVNLEFGYHIYSKDKDHYNPYDNFNSNNLVTKELYFKSIYKNNNKCESVYESIKILSNLVKYNGYGHWMYIGYLENKQIINFDFWYNKNIKIFELNNWYENDLSVLKKELAKEYFIELKNIINVTYKEWESLGSLNIFQERAVFKALVKHFNNKINI